MSVLQQASALCPEHVDVLAELAIAAQRTDPATAASAFERLEAALAAQGVAMPAAYWHNLGVQYHKLGRLDDALSAYEKALLRPEGWRRGLADPLPAPSAEEVTTVYNIALAQEAAGRIAEAQRVYKAILGAFPNYADCKQRRLLPPFHGCSW